MQRGHTTLARAILAGILAAPLGWLLAFVIVGAVLHATPRELAGPFIFCWLASAALGPFMYWADKRAVESANPRFVVLKIAPYFLVLWLAFGYLLVRHRLMTPLACAALGLIVGGLPLALLFWSRPKVMRDVLVSRRAAGRGPKAAQ